MKLPNPRAMGFPPLKVRGGLQAFNPWNFDFRGGKKAWIEFFDTNKGWEGGVEQVTERLQAKTPGSDLCVNPWDGSSARHHPRFQ